ncbi:MAG: ATP-binding protein [Candidatus Obscuribacterales bacterium]|nr:ATP-binding protein [Candidatus Obscuribacterales bacterium]
MRQKRAQGDVLTTYDSYDTAASKSANSRSSGAESGSNGKGRLSLEIVNPKDLLESILESIGLGVIVADPNGKIVLFNGTAAELLSLDTTEAVSTEWAAISGLYHVDQITPLTETENPLVRAIHGESVDDLEMYVHSEQGTGRYVSARCRPVINKGGLNKGGVIVLQDITEQKRLADEVMRSNKELQQFAYVAAHDLQEPLRSIIGFGELLQQATKDSLEPKQQDQLRRVMDASKRMQCLISGLLAYARIETRSKQFAICDLNEIVENTLQDLSSAIAAKHATVDVGPLPKVLGDRSQLIQLFQNLLSNALKYSVEKPMIAITCSSDKKFHRFCIADNGIGIDMQFADRIFVIFQRLHTKSQYEGVGIGLSLCKKIAEKHGGRIWIESKSGEGTNVYFTLPKKFEGK